MIRRALRSLRAIVAGPKDRQTSDLAELYRQLRTVALDSHSPGLLIEMREVGIGTILYVTGAGDTSLYRSDAPPLLGCAARASVRTAGERLAGFSTSFRHELSPCSAHPTAPEDGEVLVCVRDAAGLFAKVLSQDLLEEGDSPLSALWFAAEQLLDLVLGEETAELS